MTVHAISLDDPEALDHALVGSKAAGLAELRSAGFDVPDGIVLPVGVGQDLTADQAPAWVLDGIQRACEQSGGPIAVRSSATWEDTATSAHAGATTTVLGVDGTDATLRAVRRCVEASADAQQSLRVDGDVAVLLQHMVMPDWAGVAFTADPITGERDLVRIAATQGLGEALVQGDVVGSDITVRGDTIDGDLAGMPDADALAVAKVARDIEALHGGPQDVEWAVVQGQVHVLQARPITVLPVKPTPPEGNNWQKDVAHYPEPLTPFGWSLLHACADEVHAVFDEMGLLVRGLEEVFVGGENYGRVIPVMGSPNSAGNPPPAFVLGLAARIVPKLRRRTAIARQAIETRQVQGWTASWHDSDRAEMQARNVELLGVDLASLDDRELLEHHDQLLAHARRGIRIHFQLTMALMPALYRLHALVSDQLGWEDSTTSQMLVGHSPATRAAEESMAQLREQVRSTAGAVAALEEHPHRPVQALRDIDNRLGEELANWITEHGWAMVNYDAGVPVLAERPSMVARLIMTEPSHLDLDHADEVAGRARSELPAGSRSEFDDALREARALYPVREDNTIIVGDRPMALLRRWMLEVAHRLTSSGSLPSPDDAAYLFIDELFDAMAGRAPHDLTDRVIRRRGEEAWVRANPGPLYVGKQGKPPDIAHLPAPLRQVNEPVLWFIDHEYPAPVEKPDDASVILAGVAASAGVAEGPVRVIRGHRDMERLQDGDILVCQVTSPSWAPLFSLANAVVADGGGTMSHAAIAAREHGLPAVLGTGSATTTLQDGQLVRVDGTRGLVSVAEASS